MSDTLKNFLRDYADVPGYFAEEAMFDWDFFFRQQQASGIGGHFLEIGVYEGKSAVLGASYMRPDEQCFFNDIHSMEGCAGRISRFRPDNNTYIQAKSSELWHDPRIIALKRTFRWIHVDADHTGYATFQDLLLAAELVADRGIICVDDFFHFRYPQITAAVYRFLFDHSFEFIMVYCGRNKCYICRSDTHRFYEELLRRHYLADSEAAGMNLHVQLNKTSYVHDFGCLSTSPKISANRFVGPDSAPGELVF